MHRSRKVGLLELVLLADVDDHGTVAVSAQLDDVLGIDLLDLLLDLANQLCAGRHRDYLKTRSEFNTSESVAGFRGTVYGVPRAGAGTRTAAGAPFRTPRRKTQT